MVEAITDTEYFLCPNCNKEVVEELQDLYGKVSAKEFLQRRYELVGDNENEEAFGVQVTVDLPAFDSTITLKLEAECNDCDMTFTYETKVDIFDKEKNESLSNQV